MYRRVSDLKFIKDNYIIILIFLLGAALRIYNLTAQSVWFDEAFSVSISNQSPLDIIEVVFNRGIEGNPPLYYIFLHYWVQVFGESEFSIRFPSVILGSLSVLAIYTLGNAMFGKRTGLIAALILSVSVFNIQFSQEARAYSMMAFFSILSFYYLVKLTSRRSVTYSALYLLTTIIMVYSHYYGVFVIAAQNVFCLTLFLTKRKADDISIKRWILLQIILVLAFIPGLLHLMKIGRTIQQSFWIEEPTIELLGRYFVRYSGSIYLLILFMIFIAIAIISLRRINRAPGLKSVFAIKQSGDTGPGISNGFWVYLLVLWFLFPVIIPFIISVVSNPMFVARYAITTTLAFYLLASYGISGLRSKWAVGAVGLLVLGLSLINLPSYYSLPYKHQWRDVVAEIEDSAGTDDVIIVYPAHEQMSLDYYKTRDDLTVLAAPQKFPAFRGLGDRSIWVIMHAHPQNRESIRQGLSAKYNFELAKSFVRLDLFRLKQK